MNPQLIESPSMNLWTGTSASFRIPSTRQLSVTRACVCSVYACDRDTERWESVTPLTAGFLQLFVRKPSPSRDKRKNQEEDTEERERESARGGGRHSEMLPHPGEELVQRWGSWNNRAKWITAKKTTAWWVRPVVETLVVESECWAGDPTVTHGLNTSARHKVQSQVWH